MIRAILLDLDDTLITTHSESFFPDYVALMAKRLAALVQEEATLSALRSGVRQASANLDPLKTAEEAFMAAFLEMVNRPPEEVRKAFETFYTVDFPSMRGRITPRPQAVRLLDWLFSHDYIVVVATNPVTPESTIRQRMAWGEIPIERYPFTLVTTLETMHFTKPNPEYYDEILARAGARPEEALMVGDDWERDIAGPISAGLSTFWVTNGHTPPDGQRGKADGHGSFDTFVDGVVAGWLDTLEPPCKTRDALLHQLSATPAAIDALLRDHPTDVIARQPSPDEWSVLITISHLRCHERSEDRPWLKRILAEDDPFISATHSQETHAPRPQAPHEELRAFAEQRKETVAWLKTLPDEVWARRARHSIFGPTCFREMIGFMAEHDRTHLRQMHVAIDHVTRPQAR
jgi:FMN phosphatase YigB (HAD superfamily)